MFISHDYGEPYISTRLQYNRNHIMLEEITVVPLQISYKISVVTSSFIALITYERLFTCRSFDKIPTYLPKCKCAIHENFICELLQ